MNMKKLVALLLALVMVFALCACGPKDNQDTGKKDDGKKTAMKADDIPDEMTSSEADGSEVPLKFYPTFGPK